jgi:hypothetical protein
LIGNWLCCYNLIMLLNFQSLWLCYIFSIIHHVIIICGVSGWKLYFVVFQISKVGVGFTSPSEHMCHPFRNDAHHIKLWDASFSNCPAYFGQSENGDQHVLSGYASSCISFVHGFGGVTPVILCHINIVCVIREQWGYATEITNGRYMRASVTR